MSRWCLSTVRALGGHDTNQRLFHFFPQTPRSRFIHICSHVALPVVEEPGFQTVASSSAQSHQIEERNRCRTAYSRTSSSAIDTLKQFLSIDNIASDHPFIYSPTIIRSLYYRVESRNQLGMVDSRMLTLLIGLFGSLSVDPSIPVAYREPLASRFLQVPSRRTHWAFVLKVGRYKLERGMPLQDPDRFWLMRAELGIVQTRSPLEPLSCDAYNAILRARTHYHIIRRHFRCPEIHARYLEVLLAIRDPRLLNFAACDLSFILRTHRVFHPRLQRLLYRLAIQYGGLLSTRSQETILAALWSRSCRGANRRPNLVPENGLSDTTSDNYFLNATTIARSLSVILFGFTDRPLGDESTNLLGPLLSAFSPACALPLRWSSLVLFSIFNSSETLQFTGTHWTCERVVPQVTLCWQVILGLATIERIILRDPSVTLATPTTSEGVLKTTRTLYRLWLPMRESPPISGDLACAVTASFLRIACVLADATLFRDCQDLYHAEKGTEGHQTPAQIFLTSWYIAAGVRVQGPLSDLVLGTLNAFSLGSKLQHQALVSTMKALAPIDASLAYTLHSFAQKNGTVLDAEVTYALAMTSAQCGAFREAILFINDSHFSLEKRGVLISAIARRLRENPQTRHPPSTLVAIVNELAALYHSHVPPEHFRGHLEQLLITLARHGRSRQLFPMILSIFKRSPGFLQPQFFARYCHTLMRSRQFSTASKLLGAITSVHPKATQTLRILMNRTMMQTKAFRMFKRITLLRGPTSLGLSSRLQRHPPAGPLLEISLQELLKSGRVLAAKRIFARAAATISARRCTALGNILLHGVSRQPTSRNGRSVRKVLALMETLAKSHGFRPDRVTVNVLIKVMVRWRSVFNSARLRELFDELVRSGFPAADYSPSHPPFGTQRTQLSDLTSFPKLLRFLSFEKHTRPLFKMFIKAFYLSNDVEAARRVVGILKVEAYKNATAKEVRQRARSRGRIKAGLRHAIPLDVTVSSID